MFDSLTELIEKIYLEEDSTIELKEIGLTRFNL